ncbi:MAG TPA: peptide ABC transporter substrate-binding protein [Candidatus Baltobacteraceae bacterium]|nr:peptide ABC transporter substrate-binding protein [Candidatus Baltobacteraceae bacterium]
MKLVERGCALLLAAAIVGLSGCRSGGTEMVGGRHSWTQPHVLRMADLSDPDSLNEDLSTMDMVYFLSSMIYSYLVVSDDQGRIVGDLALEVPTLKNGGISRDGRTYTYHLRHGVRWHDGRPLTARDVRFSWQAIVNPNNNALHREGFTEIQSIDTPDDDTVVVHLKRRYPPFVSKFFAPLQEGGKPILPQHILGKYPNFNQVPFNSAPIGSGPFKFLKWERGREVVLVRNPYYYRGAPKLDRVELHIIPDDQTILNEVRLHHIDLVLTPSVSQYPQYRTLDGVVAETHPWNSQELLAINDAHPGLDDVRVRQAISQAIDYKAVITKITRDTGEQARDFIPPTAIGFAGNAPYDYDPKAAAKLLDDAGYKTGPDGVRAKGKVRLEYTLATISGSVALRSMAVVLQQYFSTVGIKLNIRMYPYNGMFTPDGPTYSGKYDFAMYGVTLTWDPDMSFYLNCDAFYPKGENIYHYCDPKTDALETRGLGTEDAAEREAIYKQVEPMYWNAVPYIPLYERRRIVIRSADLKNFKTNPSSTPWFNTWEWDI